jgi:hypothetical protein
MTKFSGHRRWGPGSVSSKFGGDPTFWREAIAREASAPAEWGLLPKERHSYYRRLPAVGQAFTPRDDTCDWLSFHTSHPGSQTDRQTDRQTVIERASERVS